VTLVEQKSGYAVITKVDRKTAELVRQAIINKLEPLGFVMLLRQLKYRKAL
jgi:IS30 family transposase